MREQTYVFQVAYTDGDLHTEFRQCGNDNHAVLVAQRIAGLEGVASVTVERVQS